MLPRRLYLTCHGLGIPSAGSDEAAARFWLPPELFERTLHVAAAIERRVGVDIRFTFDDGNASDHDIALPLLLAHGRRAKFFVCGERIGQPGYLDAGQLRGMTAANMIIGCHGYSHVSWRSLTDAALTQELQAGRRAIEAVTGRPVDVASAPFGELDHRVVQAAAAAGFKCLFASSGGFATSDTGLIPRNTLKQGFVPERDLPRMAARPNRAWAGVYDTARRIKYRFF